MFKKKQKQRYKKPISQADLIQKLPIKETTQEKPKNRNHILAIDQILNFL